MIYWISPNTFWLSINKIIKLILVFFLILTFFYKNANADNTGIIKIPKLNRSSQLVGAEVIGALFKMVGEKVEYVSVDSKTVYQLLANGEIDIVHDAFGEIYFKVLSEGKIEEATTHEAVYREGWWYPRYVERLCPGMPDWKALEKCSDKFTRPDSNGKGVFIGGLAEWSKEEAKKIELHNMNFTIKNFESSSATWAELDEAVKQRKPIVIFNWSTNFVGSKYNGKFVEFFDYEPKHLKIALNLNFKKNHPNAYKVIKKINFSNPDINKMANYMETDGLELSHAVEQWFKDHKKKWSKWIE